jgi:serine phosphatase RsbU (regulator of sigma subunit)
VPATSERDIAEAIADVARRLYAEPTAQRTLQTMVELAASTVPGCEHAGVSIGRADVEPPAASDGVPVQVHRIQYDVGEGPWLDAIRHDEVLQSDDLRTEDRWPRFSSRVAAETGILSMVSFRLFVQDDILGALNLYSSTPGAFDADSRRIGAVFAAHAAVALETARRHDRFTVLAEDLRGSREETRRYALQAELAVTLQRNMLPELPDLAPLAAAARYVPAAEVADVGGDWYDAFRLPTGAIAAIVGDIAGHDIGAAVCMGQARSILRALAVDRSGIPPGELLTRFDAVLDQLRMTRTATCVYAKLDHRDGQWHAVIANAGHPPPLWIADGEARFLEAAPETLLGAGREARRSSVGVALPPGSTLLLYTDGLVERRDRSFDVMLAELRAAAAPFAGAPVDRLCDEMLDRFAAKPFDDVCLLAIRAPGPA